MLTMGLRSLRSHESTREVIFAMPRLLSLPTRCLHRINAINFKFFSLNFRCLEITDK